jgi:hypothetical protein
MSLFYVQLPTLFHLSQLSIHIPTFVSKDEVTSSLEFFQGSKTHGCFVSSLLIPTYFHSSKFFHTYPNFYDENWDCLFNIWDMSDIIGISMRTFWISMSTFGISVTQIGTCQRTFGISMSRIGSSMNKFGICHATIGRSMRTFGISMQQIGICM